MTENSLITRGIGWAINFFRTYRSWLVALLIILIAVYSVQQYLWSTQQSNIYVRSDSVAYLWSAENLVKGYGVGRLDGGGNFVPYTHWPPLYPIILAGINLMGFQVLDGARILGAICIVLTIVLVGLTVARITDNSPAYVAGALIILMFSPFFYETNYFAMTEPAYMVFSLAALLLLDQYFDSNKRYLLVLASVFIGMTMLTRYVGISLVMACWLVLLLQKNTWRRRLLDCLLMGVLSLTPSIIWFLRNIIVSGNATNRLLSIYSITSTELAETAKLFLGIIAPIQKSLTTGIAKTILIVFISLVIAAIYFRFVPKRSPDGRQRFILLIAVYTLSYGVFIVLARLMFDPYIPLYEYRIQFPFVLGCFFLVLYLLFRLQVQVQSKGWVFPMIVVGIFALVAWINIRGYRGDFLTFSTIGHNAGFGIARGMDQELIKVLDQYREADYRFYSDDIEKLYFDSLQSINSYSTYSMTSDQFATLISETSLGKVALVVFEEHELSAQYQAVLPGMHLVYQDGADVYVAP